MGGWSIRGALGGWYIGPGRLCQHNFKHNGLPILVRNYARINWHISHLNGNNSLQSKL